MVRFFQNIIRVYIFVVSPLLGRNCRFHPTCSSYAHQALEKHGIFKGFYLIFLRILCCQPFSKRNFNDPVPSTFAWKEILGYKRASSTSKTVSSGLNYKDFKGTKYDER